MKKGPLAILFMLVFLGANAQQKHALLIGINTYSAFKSAETRNTPPDLQGCVNDVISVKELLNTRLGFTEKSIRMLLDKDATRDGILAEIGKVLSLAKKGDIVFMYYSGHGSQVINSLGGEADNRDESIVPVNAGAGAKHIRDKELARLIQKFVDKGVIITFIFDSCHSGSIGRDITSTSQNLRFTLPDNEDAKDGAPAPSPEDNGALIISASQDDEPAKEVIDENVVYHGGFTVSFLKAVNSMSVNASVKDLFTSTRAMVKSMNLAQEPVLQCNSDRLNNALLGVRLSRDEMKTRVAVIKALAPITLQGGIAINLHEGSLLHRVYGLDTVVISVIKNEGLNRSTAEVVKGNSKLIKSGDLFEVVRWMTKLSVLKIYIPGIKQNATELKKDVASWMATNKNIAVTFNPMAADARRMLYYERNWMSRAENATTQPAGKDLKDVKLNGDEKVFMSVPLPESHLEKLKTALTENVSVKFVSEISEADYVLVGSMPGSNLEYAFVNPSYMYDSGIYRTPLPIITKYVTAGSEDVVFNDSLLSIIDQLAKIKSWVSLAATPDEGSFPFMLKLYNLQSKKFVEDNTEVNPGDKINCMLVVDRDKLPYWSGDKRYVYVFLLDSKGKMQLIYGSKPESTHKFPKMLNEFDPMDSVFFRPKLVITVDETFGTDSYFMLTSDEPIVDPSGIFNMEEVGSTRREENAITRLLTDSKNKTRSADLSESPDNWSINRIMIRCKPKN